MRTFDNLSQTVNMELLDSRCSVCKGMSFQCSKCASKDKLQKKQARLAATAAKLAAPAVARLAGPPSGSSLVDVIPDDLAQLTDQEMDHILGKNSPLKATPTARCISAVALPATRSHKGDKVSSVAKDAPKVNLRNILKSPPHEWTMAKIPRLGHCLFESIAMAFRKLKRPELPQTMQELRTRCARQLLDWNGVIPGNNIKLLEFSNGVARVQVVRGEKEVDVTLQEHCQLLATNLYGGYDEFMIIVQMYKVQIHVYHDESYKGGDSEPVSIHVVISELPANHDINSGNSIHSLNAVLF
jgi:hypothetical protein